MELRFIDTTDPSYPEELELRYRALREPLGQARSDVVFPFEPRSLHLVALEQTGVVGCVLFHPEELTSGRLYQMAVDPSRRGQGLVRAMVRALEAELRRRGVREVHVHARAHVVPFYERLGYVLFGEPFVEVSIAHRHMSRML